MSIIVTIVTALAKGLLDKYLFGKKETSVREVVTKAYDKKKESDQALADAEAEAAKERRKRRDIEDKNKKDSTTWGGNDF